MKVIHVVLGKANPHRMNGINAMVHVLATEARRQGKEVKVWGLTLSPDSHAPDRAYPLSLFKARARSFLISADIRDAVKSLQDDVVVHFHGVFIPVFYRMAVLLKKRGVPWVISPHGALSPQSMRRHFFRKWFYLIVFDRFILAHAKAIHATTPSEAQAAKRWKAKNSVIIPNAGFVMDDCADDTYPTCDHVKPVYGFVGRLNVAHKGLDLLLRAFSLYLEQGGKGELWLVGDGPDRKALHALARKLGLGPQVHFWGPRFGEEKKTLIQNMTVFVHTSRWEGMPISVLEAASMQKPLLVSYGTGLADSVAHWQAGISVKGDSVYEIAEAFKKYECLVEQGALKAMGKRAREMIVNDYNATAIAQSFYDRVYAAS